MRYFLVKSNDVCVGTPGVDDPSLHGILVSRFTNPCREGVDELLDRPVSGDDYVPVL